MFFENKTDFGGKSIDISIKSEENKTIVAFDDSTSKCQLCYVICNMYSMLFSTT
jgi:hypothetical protein